MSGRITSWPLLDALAPGSFLVMSHVTGDHNPEQIATVAEVYHSRGLELQPRSHGEFAQFFAGLEVIEPGITGPHHWHPESEPTAEMDAQVSFYSAVAQKP